MIPKQCKICQFADGAHCQFYNKPCAEAVKAGRSFNGCGIPMDYPQWETKRSAKDKKLDVKRQALEAAHEGR